MVRTDLRRAEKFIRITRLIRRREFEGQVGTLPVIDPFGDLERDMERRFNSRRGIRRWRYEQRKRRRVADFQAGTKWKVLYCQQVNSVDGCCEVEDFVG